MDNLKSASKLKFQELYVLDQLLKGGLAGDPLENTVVP
jgi:hypothetical protein